MNAQIAQELASRHQVTVLTSQGAGLPRVGVEAGVQVIRVPVFFRNRNATANFHSMFAYITTGIKAGLKLLEGERFDVINTHFVLPTGPVGDFLAHSAGIPNVLTLHGGDLYDPSKLSSPHRHAPLRAWVRWLLRRADVVVGQSHNTLDNMRKFYTPEIAGLRIPLGIPRLPHLQAKRGDYGFSPDQVLLITVGRLVARKAVDQLITMLSQVEDERVHLIVVGDGPEKEFLERQARALGLAGRIQFTGFVEENEKIRLLELADIYVSTSQHEGFCLSYLEAMHNGLPLVTYDCGGHTDYLTNGETGFVVPLNDLNTFTQRTRQLIESPSLRGKFREHNLKVIEEYYVDSMAASYESVFANVIQQYKDAPKVGGELRSRSVSLD